VVRDFILQSHKPLAKAGRAQAAPKPVAEKAQVMNRKATPKAIAVKAKVVKKIGHSKPTVRKAAAAPRKARTA
jgi:hypothetical protein